MGAVQRELHIGLLRHGASEELRRYLAQQKEQLAEQLRQAGAYTVSVFAGMDWVCAYGEWEPANSPACLTKLHGMNDCLQPWPGPSGARYLLPMMDVFHDGVPESFDEWRGSRPIQGRKASIAALRPEQYASYVFYHYQMQEEKPETFNRTYMIGAFENVIISYHEEPAFQRENKRAGRLHTNQTPKDWHTVMEPHFESKWQPMELIFSI